MKFTDYFEYKAILGFKNCHVRLSKITYGDQYQEVDHTVKSDAEDDLDGESFKDSIDQLSFTSALSVSSRRSSNSYPSSTNVLSQEQICKECRVDVKKLEPSIVPKLLCSSSASPINVLSSKGTAPANRKRIRLEIQRGSGSYKDDVDDHEDDHAISSPKRAKLCYQSILSNYGVKNCYVKVLKVNSKETENRVKEKETLRGQRSKRTETNLELVGIPDLELQIDSDSDEESTTTSSSPILIDSDDDSITVSHQSSSNSPTVRNIDDEKDEDRLDEQLSSESEQSIGKPSSSEDQLGEWEGDNDDDGQNKEFKVVFSTLVFDDDVSTITDLQVKPKSVVESKSITVEKNKSNINFLGLKSSSIPVADQQNIFPDQRKLQPYKIKKYVGKTAEELRKSRSIPESVHINLEEQLKKEVEEMAAKIDFSAIGKSPLAFQDDEFDDDELKDMKDEEWNTMQGKERLAYIKQRFGNFQSSSPNINLSFHGFKRNRSFTDEKSQLNQEYQIQCQKLCLDESLNQMLKFPDYHERIKTKIVELFLNKNECEVEDVSSTNRKVEKLAQYMKLFVRGSVENNSFWTFYFPNQVSFLTCHVM